MFILHTSDRSCKGRANEDLDPRADGCALGAFDQEESHETGRKRSVWTVLALAVLGLGCGTEAVETARDIADEEEAILEAFQTWEEAAAREDAAALAAVYTENALFLPPGAEPVEGRQAIRALMEQQFEMADVQADFTTDELIVMSSWAFRRGHYTARARIEATGDTVSSRAKFIEIWRRGDDGTWRIARDIME